MATVTTMSDIDALRLAPHQVGDSLSVGGSGGLIDPVKKKQIDEADPFFLQKQISERNIKSLAEENMKLKRLAERDNFQKRSRALDSASLFRRSSLFGDVSAYAQALGLIGSTENLNRKTLLGA